MRLQAVALSAALPSHETRQAFGLLVGNLIGRDVSSGADRAGFGGIIGVPSGCQRSARVGGHGP